MSRQPGFRAYRGGGESGYVGIAQPRNRGNGAAQSYADRGAATIFYAFLGGGQRGVRWRGNRRGIKADCHQVALLMAAGCLSEESYGLPFAMAR